MRTPIDDIMARLSTLVKYGVERMFVRLNLILALLLATYALIVLYQFHTHDMATWDSDLSCAVMLVCSILILVDRDRNLMRSVGLMSIAIGCQRALTSIPMLVPHDVQSLLPLAQIILGINLMVSGRSYMRGVSRGRVMMTISTMLILIITISLIIILLGMGLSFMDCLRMMPETFNMILLYVVFLAVLDSEPLRKNDIMEIHNATLKGIRNTYVQSGSSYVTEDVAGVLLRTLTDRGSWNPVSDGGPVESEYRFQMDSLEGISYVTLQKWAGSDAVHATICDHSEGTLIHAQRFDVRDVYLDGDTVAGSEIITVVGDGRCFELRIMHPEEDE